MIKTNPFVKIAAGALLLLLIPYSLMTFKVPLYDPGSGFEILNWTLFDFFVMGMLIFSVGSLFVLTARLVPPNRRLPLGIVFIIAFLWLWAELAVGIFTNWGS